MRIKLKANGLGLQKTDDGLWGIRQIGLKMWAVQMREDATDPYGWEIIGYTETGETALALLHKTLLYG